MNLPNGNPLWKGEMKLREMGNWRWRPPGNWKCSTLPMVFLRPALHARPGHAINPNEQTSFRDSCPSCHCNVQMCLQDSTTAHPWNTSLGNPLTILIPVAILTHMVVSCWTSQRAAVGVSSTSSIFSWFFPVLQPCLEMTPANDANA